MTDIAELLKPKKTNIRELTISEQVGPEHKFNPQLDISPETLDFLGGSLEALKTTLNHDNILLLLADFKILAPNTPGISLSRNNVAHMQEEGSIAATTINRLYTQKILVPGKSLNKTYSELYEDFDLDPASSDMERRAGYLSKLKVMFPHEDVAFNSMDVNALRPMITWSFNQYDRVFDENQRVDYIEDIFKNLAPLRILAPEAFQTYKKRLNNNHWDHVRLLAEGVSRNTPKTLPIVTNAAIVAAENITIDDSGIHLDFTPPPDHIEPKPLPVSKKF